MVIDIDLNRCLPLFDPKQFGALKGRSTMHERVELLHTWNEALDQRKCVRVLFVDFQKAFDYVDHTTVIPYVNSSASQMEPLASVAVCELSVFVSL